MKDKNFIRKIMKKKFSVSKEVEKFPFYGEINETDVYLSEKISCFTFRIGGKIVKKTRCLLAAGRKKAKRLMVSEDLKFPLGTAVGPSCLAVGFPMFTMLTISRKDITIILFCTVIGGVLQIISTRYLTKHPELLDETNEKPSLPDGSVPSGGALIEISGITIKKVLVKVVLGQLAKNGLMAGLFAGTTSIAVSKIPKDAIALFLRDAMPQNLPDLDNNQYIMIEGEQIFLDQCEPTLRYLFAVLTDKDIPFAEKQKEAASILRHYLNLNTLNGRIYFIICLSFILYIFYRQNMASYYIIMKNLIKAIREGRISKILGRAIVRKLKRKGLPIDPELAELVYS